MITSLYLWQRRLEHLCSQFGRCTLATLYEIWAFFALVDEIASVLDQSPVIDLRLSDQSGLEWEAKAHFGPAGSLLYNHQYYFPNSYSVPLRPDFSWIENGRAKVVLDAKFRLERQVIEVSDNEDTEQATAKRADLYKMHTYRDALKVRSAVAIYPGDVSLFYDCIGGRCTDFELRDLLFENYVGVGAIAMNPWGQS